MPVFNSVGCGVRLGGKVSMFLQLLLELVGLLRDREQTKQQEQKSSPGNVVVINITKD